MKIYKIRKNQRIDFELYKKSKGWIRIRNRCSLLFVSDGVDLGEIVFQKKYRPIILEYLQYYDDKLILEKPKNIHIPLDMIFTFPSDSPDDLPIIPDKRLLYVAEEIKKTLHI